MFKIPRNSCGNLINGFSREILIPGGPPGIGISGEKPVGAHHCWWPSFWDRHTGWAKLSDTTLHFCL